MKIIDFRSDTVTQPTLKMREAMLKAPVGDDVYGDDPTVNELEALAASLLGKEAAVFMPTGTMGNQASIMAQTRPGDEIIAAAHSHIIHHEAGAPARLSGVSAALVDKPALTAADIHWLRREPGNIHYPRTSLVCVENALGGGRVMPLNQMKQVYEAAKSYGLSVHLDGARIFNAAQSLGVKAADIAAYADSVMFCISKGLCAPVGSLVCGPGAFIGEVRRCRKLLGGGMRQAGLLAACGLIALNEMTGRLGEDHENAKHLGRLLADIPGLTVDLEGIEINMVFWQVNLKNFNEGDYLSFMAQEGFKLNGSADGFHRLVTHHGITKDDVEAFAACLKDYLASLN